MPLGKYSFRALESYMTVAPSLDDAQIPDVDDAFPLWSTCLSNRYSVPVESVKVQ